jgi:Fe-S-cluster-containing dehydrogenase component
MRKTLMVDLDKCTGCETCVDICSGRKRDVYFEGVSRIKMLKYEAEALFIPLVCEQCREHTCFDVCAVGAIHYDEDLGIFRVDESLCTGCGVCEEACPYNGIFISDGLAIKCDLCEGNPACVAICYPGALQLLEVTPEAVLLDLENKMNKLKQMRRVLDE